MAAGSGLRDTATSFGAMGMAYAADMLGLKDDKGMFGVTRT